MSEIQFNIHPSEFVKQSPNLEQIKVYFTKYSHIAISHLGGIEKLRFIQFLLKKFPSRNNIILCANNIDNIRYKFDYEKERSILWDLLIRKVINKKKPLNQFDYAEILTLIKFNLHLIDGDLILEFLEYILASDNEFEDSTFKSIFELLFYQDKINYDLLKSEKLNRYYKNNIRFLFDIVSNKHKMDILLFTLEQSVTSKNIKFVLNVLPKCQFKNNIDKDIISDKLYEIVLTKKFIGLNKSDYILFFTKSKKSIFNDRLFEYLLSKYKLEFSECFNLLEMEIKKSQKKALMDYILSNFDLDKNLSKKLLKLPISYVSYDLRNKLFKNIISEKPSFNFLKRMYLTESYQLKIKQELEVIIMDLYPSNMVNYLENKTLNFESIYDYENDYQIELEVINSNRNYCFD
jgi:hypothetical protein